MKDYDEDTHIVTLEERNYFEPGMEVQFIGPKMATINYVVNKIYDEEMKEITVANHPGMIIKLVVDFPLKPYDMMRLKVFDKNDYLV